MRVTVKRAAGVAGAAVVGAALWWRRNPSACPYNQRFWVQAPHPLITRPRLRETLAPGAGERLLEVGPGTGYYALEVAEWIGPDGRLDVFDLQQEMLDHTLLRAGSAGSRNIVAVLGDARELPYGEDEFDAAYLVTVLGEIPDQEAALRELARVVKPGGRVVVGELFGDPHWVSPGACGRAQSAPGCASSAASAARSATSRASRPSSVRTMDAAFTPTHRGGSGEPLLLLHGFTDTWRTWELVLPALERSHDVLAPTLAGHAGGPPLEGDDRATPRSSTRSSARWTRPASRPRTSSATRSAATSRCSSRRAAARARSWRSRRPAAGPRATTPYEETLGYFATMQELLDAGRAARGRDRRHAGGPPPRDAASSAERFEHIPAELLAHQMRGAAALPGAVRADRARAPQGLEPRRRADRRARCGSCGARRTGSCRGRRAAARYREQWLPQADWVELDGVGHCPQLDVPAGDGAADPRLHRRGGSFAVPGPCRVTTRRGSSCAGAESMTTVVADGPSLALATVPRYVMRLREHGWIKLDMGPLGEFTPGIIPPLEVCRGAQIARLLFILREPTGMAFKASVLPLTMDPESRCQRPNPARRAMGGDDRAAVAAKPAGTRSNSRSGGGGLASQHFQMRLEGRRALKYDCRRLRRADVRWPGGNETAHVSDGAMSVTRFSSTSTTGAPVTAVLTLTAMSAPSDVFAWFRAVWIPPRRSRRRGVVYDAQQVDSCWYRTRVARRGQRVGTDASPRTAMHPRSEGGVRSGLDGESARRLLSLHGDLRHLLESLRVAWVKVNADGTVGLRLPQ